MVLGFPGPEAGASLKQTWKTWKTWETCFFHGFGFPRPGGRLKSETDLENLEKLFFHSFGLPRPGGRSKFETDPANLENLENQFVHGFGLLLE